MALQIWLPLTKNALNYGVHPSNVTVSNATLNSNGKLGGCYSFNGSSSHIHGTQTVITNNTDNWTFACWMKLNVVNTTQTLFSCRTEVNVTGITIFYSNGYWLIDDGVRWQPTNSLSTNTWYHVCIVRKKGVGKYLYINGALVSSTTTVGTQTTVNSTNFAIGLCHQSASAYSGNPLNGYLNDVRFYDHALSPIEVAEIGKGLCVHYKLDTPSSIRNLVRNVSYSVYNNYASAGFTATIANTGRTYNSCKIYRLTYTPGSDTTKLNNVKTSLANHGIRVPGIKFLANTKYCFWILCKPISHPDTIVGGTASNISGWTEIPMKKYTDDWFIVGQCRKGNVTTDKTDSIFTSFKTPSAEAGVPITIDFCCPHLLEGYDNILPEYDYIGTDPGIVDSSGYNNHGTGNGSLTVSTSTSRYSYSTVFDGSSAYIDINNAMFPAILNESFTLSMWIYNSDSGDRSILFGNYGLTGSFFNIEKTTAEKVRFYWNASPDITLANTLLTANAFSHLVITKSGSTVKSYINGVLKDTSTTTLTGTIPSTATNFRIGSDNRTGATMFKGRISDFRLYATALSADDIKRLYEVSASVSKNNSMLGYEMKEG